MRIVLSTSTLVLPSLVGAKLPNQRGTNHHAASTLTRTYQAPNQESFAAVHNEDMPLWKRPQARVQQVLTDPQDGLEPDVGILLSRILQPQPTDNVTSDNTTTTYAMIACDYVDSMNGTTCDCQNWQADNSGNFTCSFYDGNEYCFDSNETACGKFFFVVNSDGTNVTFEYRIETTTFDHIYRAAYHTSLDAFLNSGGNLMAVAEDCALTVDGTQCNSCTMQKDCFEIDGQEFPNPGPFDCSNTDAGTLGNVCDGDVVFPYFGVSNSSATDNPTPTSSPATTDSGNSPTASTKAPVADSGSAAAATWQSMTLAASAFLAASMIFVW